MIILEFQRRGISRFPRLVRLVPLVVVTALVIAGCTPSNGAGDASNQPSSATTTPPLDGKFLVSYQAAKTPDTKVEETFLKQRKLLESFVENMNSYLKVPRDIKVVAKDCGESNAFYDPAEHSIEVCYELSAEERGNFSKAGDSGAKLNTLVEQSMVATLYHELGHAVIGELELKTTGKEEDVADQMAAYILTNDDESKDYLLTTADSYALRADLTGTPDKSAYADTHSLDAQRAVNFLCYVYGSDEKTFHTW